MSNELSVLNAFEDLVGNFTLSFIITPYYFVTSTGLTVPSLRSLSELVLFLQVIGNLPGKIPRH